MLRPWSLALAVGGVATLSLCGVLLWTGEPGLSGFDSTYALAWGHELTRGRLPLTLPPAASTPHPVALLVGAAIALVHLPRGTLVAMGAAAWAGSVTVYAALAAYLVRELRVVIARATCRDVTAPASDAANHREGRHGPIADRHRSHTAARRTPRGSSEGFRPGRAPASVLERLLTASERSPGSPWVAAVITGVALTASPRIATLAKTGSFDVLFVLLVGASILALIQHRSALGVGLLALASCERPEGWLMLLAVVLLRPAIVASSIARAGGADAQRRTSARVWRARDRVGWLIVPPLVWLLMGLAFERPLVGLSQTQSNARLANDETGLHAAAANLLPGLSSGPGWACITLGLLGGAAYLLSLTHRRGPLRAGTRCRRRTLESHGPATLVVAFIALDVVTFLAVGAVGAAPVRRYLLAAMFLLTSVSGAVLGLLCSILTAKVSFVLRAVGPACALTVIGTAMNVASQYPTANDTLRVQNDVNGALSALLQTPAARRCQTNETKTPVVAQVPAIALDRGDLRKVDYLERLSIPGRGQLLVYPTTPTTLTDAGFGPALSTPADLPVPRGYLELGQNRYWILFGDC